MTLYNLPYLVNAFLVLQQHLVKIMVKMYETERDRDRGRDRDKSIKQGSPQLLRHTVRWLRGVGHLSSQPEMQHEQSSSWPSNKSNDYKNYNENQYCNSYVDHQAKSSSPWTQVAVLSSRCSRYRSPSTARSCLSTRTKTKTSWNSISRAFFLMN